MKVLPFRDTGFVATESGLAPHLLVPTPEIFPLPLSALNSPEFSPQLQEEDVLPNLSSMFPSEVQEGKGWFSKGKYDGRIMKRIYLGQI